MAEKVIGRNVPDGAEPASWIIREKATGKVIFETFNRHLGDTLNTEKYEFVPILEHLQSINGKTGRRMDECVLGDMFWDADDPEGPQDSPAEILDRHADSETVVEILQATREANVYAFYLNCAENPEEDSDKEYFCFATKEEAEAELARLLKREKV